MVDFNLRQISFWDTECESERMRNFKGSFKISKQAIFAMECMGGSATANLYMELSLNRQSSDFSLASSFLPWIAK